MPVSLHPFPAEKGHIKHHALFHQFSRSKRI